MIIRICSLGVPIPEKFSGEMSYQAENEEDFLSALRHCGRADVALLDANLFGRLVCYISKLYSRPVIMALTELDSGVLEQSNIRAKLFDSGVDYLLKKPICVSELTAYLEAIKSRRFISLNILKVPDLLIDWGEKTLSYKGCPIIFTKAQNRIFQFILLRDGRLAEYYELENLLSGVFPKKTVHVHISTIRKKLKDSGCPLRIVNVWRQGFLIEVVQPAKVR